MSFNNGLHRITAYGIAACNHYAHSLELVILEGFSLVGELKPCSFKTFKVSLIYRIREIRKYAVRNCSSNVTNCHQFILSGGCKCIYIAEMACQGLRCGFTNIPYSKCIKYLSERHFTALFQTLEKTFTRFFLPPVQPEQLIESQVIEICRHPDQAGIIHCPHGGIPGQDIHSLAAEKVHKGLNQLCRA